MIRSDALDKFKVELVNRRAALRSTLRGDLTILCELSSNSGDLADSALDSGYDEVTTQMVEVESRELLQINDAIARINQGDYGNCAGCHKPIPLGRLEALPFATLCIKCQMKLEKFGYSDWSQMPEDAYDSVES